MGLLDLLRGSGIHWQCQKCGHVHNSNPEKCTECGHTVLIQHRNSTDSSQSSSTSASTTFTGKHAVPEQSEWICMNCKQKHEGERDECKVCGHRELRLSGDGSPAGKIDPITHEEIEGPTISNIHDIEGYEENEEGGLSVFPVFLVVLSIILVLLALFVFGPL